MPSNVEAMERMLAPFGPRLGIHELVVEVNRIYHDHEAAVYDAIHPEVHRQLPQRWKRMVECIEKTPSPEPWRILDFGCGTGFEADQLIRLLSPESIDLLVCLDPSSGMLDRCRSRIEGRIANTLFVSRLEEVPSERYTMLATNSLLHHLPNPTETTGELMEYLTDDAWWLAGHEPSPRYYRNDVTRAAVERYRAELSSPEPRWRKYVSPPRYRKRLARLTGRERASPAAATARAATASGLFEREPRSWMIGRLVDFHVAHSAKEIEWGRGFDFEALERAFAGTWELRWHETYAFMGPYYEGRLSRKWKAVARGLAERFPDDGANFCAVWRRTRDAGNGLTVSARHGRHAPEGDGSP